MIESSVKLRPAGRLVPIFCVNKHIRPGSFALDLVQAIAQAGETVLIVDCQGGDIAAKTGVDCKNKLVDVLYSQASLSEAKYIEPHQNFTVMDAGEATLDTIMGSLAALSLQFDWVLVCTEPGCTPAHVKLAGASDISLLAYDVSSDHFMRAYWMIEACRRRFPQFDPLLFSLGDKDEALETAEMLGETIAEFLGAPPPYIGHATDPRLVNDLHSIILNNANVLRAA